MNAEELRDTTLDPANRTLLRVTMEDAGAADEMFRVLLGDKVEPGGLHRKTRTRSPQSGRLGFVERTCTDGIQSSPSDCFPSAAQWAMLFLERVHHRSSVLSSFSAIPQNE